MDNNNMESMKNGTAITLDSYMNSVNSQGVMKMSAEQPTSKETKTNAVEELKKPVKVRLPIRQRACYSVGHVFNDLCASMWFTYLLLYFTMVLEFSSSNAGLLVLIGQLADAVATPFVGLASDKENNMKIFKYGRRKTWHLIGTIFVTVSFPFLFIPCLGCQYTPHSMQMIYYSAFIILFQFGWASVQVAHLSLIPDLTKNPNERTELNAYRNAFTVISSVLVYGIAWAVLGESGNTGSIGPNDKDEFVEIVLIVTGIGLVFSVAFHIGIIEPKLPPKIKKIKPEDTQTLELDTSSVELNEAGQAKSAVQSSTQKIKNWKKWLKSFEFYKVAVLYMCTRLFVNLSQTYITLYLQNSLLLPKDSVAYIPLVVYLSGFVASLVMKPLNKKAGRLISYICGVVTGCGFCVWVFLGEGDVYKNYEIYGVAVLMGVGGTVMLVTCLSITADLIGDNVRSGAFVYGAMSFADKLSNGAVVMVVQNLPVTLISDQSFYKNVLSIGCGVPAIVAFLAIFTIRKELLNSTKAPKTESDSGASTSETVPTETATHINIGYIENEKF